MAPRLTRLRPIHANEFELHHSDFPNPGSPAVYSTCVYAREGNIEGSPEPIMLSYRYNNERAYDCILFSFTFVEDATKLAMFNDDERVDKCVEELDRILLKSTNISEKIFPYIARRQAVVQRWMNDKHSLGCAKLYRAGTYYEAIKLLAYNRNFSEKSGLYLCGESFSVDAGWTEPCFRGAIDAVINACIKTRAHFNGGFTSQDYPKYKFEP